MIHILDMSWDNWFSYGDDNYINFSNSNLLQITGSNGNGKSSIPLILQEVLFGNNTKGIKKANLLNRYTPNERLRAEVRFRAATVEYSVTYSRKGTKCQIEFFCGKEELTQHTTAKTYAAIHEVLGLDFELFSSLTYQSSNSNLGFLTSTDLQRKKFLSSFLKLDVYLDDQKRFKDLSKSLLNSLNTLEGRASILSRNVAELEGSDFSIKYEEALKTVSELDTQESIDLKSDISNIAETNTRIEVNNSTIAKIAAFPPIPAIIVEPPVEGKVDKLNSLRVEVGKHMADSAAAKATHSKLAALGDSCPTCLQDIKPEVKQGLLEEYSTTIDRASTEVSRVSAEAATLKDEIAVNKSAMESNSKSVALATRLADLTENLTDTSFSELFNLKVLEEKLANVASRIALVTKENLITAASNKAVIASNSQAILKADQLQQFSAELADELASVVDIKRRLADALVLEEAFSMKGLISYKIESLLKGLESGINKYLVELSGGELQLRFEVSGDKLNVLIISAGSDVGIASLSAGELAKVNISTLLAMRASIAPINILFLDEIAGVLDNEGKTALVEILHKEGINCFLVDHSFEHPLVETMEVIKENNISRIV